MMEAMCIPWSWPQPPFEIVLVEPCIPPNTGNAARTCAATGSRLHLIEPLGFQIDDRHLRRAGLDYWPHVDLTVHKDWTSFAAGRTTERLHLFSIHGRHPLHQVRFHPGDALVFGSETSGLPRELLNQHPERTVCLPMRTEWVRSLNLSNTVAIALYEALRQQQPSFAQFLNFSPPRGVK